MKMNELDPRNRHSLEADDGWGNLVGYTNDGQPIYSDQRIAEPDAHGNYPDSNGNYPEYDFDGKPIYPDR